MIIENKSLYFRNLDSIRFLAALMVFLGHTLSPAYKYLNITDTPIERILLLISNGGYGVSIFFVLSGFLITYLLISEYEVKSKISLKNFYVRRALRIWPLYYFVVIFSFIVYPLFKSMIGMDSPDGNHLLHHVFFISNFDVINVTKNCFGNDAMSQNITWSVSIEEQFYVLWPLFFAFFKKKYWQYVFVVLIIVCVSFRLYYNFDSIILYFHTFSVLIDLVLGALMAYLIKTKNSVRIFFEKTTSLHHFIFMCFSFILLFFFDEIFNFAFAPAISRCIISLSFVLVIASQAMTKSNSIFNLGKLKFANKWGKYTYGIYLLHPIVITLVGVLVRVLHIHKENFPTSFIIALICFVFTLIFSKISYVFFESRFLKLKNKYSS